MLLNLKDVLKRINFELGFILMARDQKFSQVCNINKNHIKSQGIDSLIHKFSIVNTDKFI